MLQKVYGPDHPEVAQTMGNLADFLTFTKGPAARGSLADFEEAEGLHRKALELNRRIRPDHPYIGDNLTALAQLRHRAGDDREAEELAREALRTFRLKLPEEHRKVARAKGRLGEILVARGRPNEAEPLLLESYRSLGGAGSEWQDDLETVRKNLVEVYRRLGKPALAAKYGAPS
jgi:tetratricopeptide (TPR) repeat protein